MEPAGAVPPSTQASLPPQISLAARMAGWFAVGALFMLGPVISR